MKNYLRLLLCLLNVLQTGQGTFAQIPLLQHYTVREGLPSNKVYCTIRDTRGFIWMATDNGLARFDGSDFKTFTVKDGLPDNDVYTVFEDHEGRLWVLTSKQTPCFFFKNKLHTAANDTFLAKYFNDPDRFRFTVNPYLKRLVFFVIWQEQYTVLEHGRPPHVLKHIREPRSRIKGGVFSLYSQDGTDYLIDAISVYNLSSGVFRAQRIPGNFTQTSLYGQDAGMSCGTNIDRAFLFRLQHDSVIRIKTFPFSCYPINTSAKPILKGSSDSLYILKEDRLLNMTHLCRSGKRFTRILHDIDNNWWFCTNNDGVYLWSPNNSDILSYGDEISTLCVSPDQKLLMAGMENKQILLTRNFRKPVCLSLPFNSPILTRITSLLPDKENVYVGGDFQLLHYQIKKTKVEVLKSDHFRSLVTFTKDLEWCSDGKLFIGATSGAGIYDPQTRRITDSIWNIRTTAVCRVDRTGDFLGTIDGLYFRKAGELKVRRFTLSPLLDKARITDIKVDKNGKIWVGTAQYGLFIFDDRNIIQIDDDLAEEASISSYFVKQIYFDTKDRAWICTDKGLNRVKLSAQNKFTVEKINTASGFVNNNVNACVMVGDTLYMATADGINRLIYTPHEPKERPGLEITQTYINNKIKALFQGIPLPFDSNSISIEYSAIAYQNPANIEFRYRLLGASESWIRTQNKRIDLLSLKPGNYRFEITARNTVTGLCSATRSLMFSVQPPWYGTWWFYLIASSILIALVLLLIKTRINAVKRHSQEINRINKTFAELEMQSLRAQMNPHFIFNAMTAIQHYFVSSTEEKANAYMSRFAHLIRQMLDYSSNNFIPLNEEIDLLRNYLDLEAMRFDFKISYTIECSDNLVTKDYRLPSLLLQPIVENAVNHGLRMAGMKGTVSIAFILTEEFLICKITDDGVGINYALSHGSQRHQHQSKGLDITRRRIESVNLMHNTQVSMTVKDLSEDHEEITGTCIQIQFPLTLVSSTINPNT